MTQDVSPSKASEESLEVYHSPKRSIAYAAPQALDPEDPYRAVIECSYTGNPFCLGGGTNSPFMGRKKRVKPYASRAAASREYGGIVYRRVGTGTEKANCGRTTTIAACADPNCASKPKPIPSSCDRYDCPTCYHHAVHRMAVRSADRVNSFRDNFKEETGLNAGRLKHFVFSFNPRKWTRERCISDSGKGMIRQVDKALKVAAKDGFYAFEMMIHLEREQHKDGSYCDREECDIPASEHVWTWGPHVHAVGYAHLMSAEELHVIDPNTRGLNIIQVPEAEGKTRDAYATLFYQGTHASVFYRVETGRQSSKLVKHLGFVSPSVYRQKLVGHTCEVAKCDCGKPMKVYPIRPDMTPDRSMDYGPQLDRRPQYAYKFNARKVAEWMRNRPQIGRLWIARRARALKERFKQDEIGGYQVNPSPEDGAFTAPSEGVSSYDSTREEGGLR